MATALDIGLGWIEPHRHLLKQPAENHQLFKITRIPYLLDMLKGNYLHFQRIDTYEDDTYDGEQLPLDREFNKHAAFRNDPDFTLEHSYDISRARTYACCFSLANSRHIWAEYGKHADSICIVLEFGRLREMLNRTMQDSVSSELLMYGGQPCRQIFSINYGVVEYIERDKVRLNSELFANPIKYAFVKERQKYANEHELRVSLSALGIGHFVLRDGTEMIFPPFLQLGFNFKAAFANRAITQLLYAPEVDLDQLRHLKDEMHNLGFNITPNDNNKS
jgi:hypothetical protein